jgi:hypothetical protein
MAKSGKETQHQRAVAPWRPVSEMERMFEFLQPPLESISTKLLARDTTSPPFGEYRCIRGKGRDRG